MRRLRGFGVVAVLGLGGVLAPSGPVAAQSPDIESAARHRGLELPAGYFQAVRREPDLFTFERALFRRTGPERAPAFGAVRLPVVLVLFDDSPLDPIVSRDDVQAALFDGPAARGTVTEAYREMSLDALTVQGDVYGWARSTLPMDVVVGDSWGLGSDSRVGDFFVEALEQLDSVIDFTQYDNDGPDGIANSGDDDGFVDVITFEYLEVAASCGGPAIWPHRSRLSSRAGAPWATNDVGANGDTIRVQDYITQSATDCTGENVQDAAVITHEFGHALGLPDWYHWIDVNLGPAGRRWVTGCWSLMGAGSWGCGPVTETRTPYGPAHMLGFSKDWLGWIDLTDPGEVWDDTIELAPIRSSGEGLRIPLDDAGEEFLLVEYREQAGFDRELPAAGVLMYKEDATVGIWTKPDPASDDPYPLTVLEQDDDRSLVLMAPEGGSRGEPGDAWGVGGSAGTLHAETSPRLRRRSGQWSSVQIHEVAVEGNRARLVLSTGRTPRLFAEETSAQVMRVRTFRRPVRVAGGVGPYEAVGVLPEGFRLEGGGDEMILSGSLRDEEPRVVTFSVRDSEGALSDEVTLTVTGTEPWQVGLGSLLQRFLDSAEPELTEGERVHLDETGNANGRYDVGDLRAWMRANR